MHIVQSTVAKAKLSELLRTVEAGESVAISRHGKVIAHLIPAASHDAAARRASIDAFMKQRETWKPTGMSIEEILAARHEGHRF